MKAFISYSHRDEKYHERLLVHITQVKRDGLIDDWSDSEIHAGDRLDETISSALSSAQIFIAMISPDYLASNYCYNKELKAALAMQNEGKLIIVPIIVEPCDWKPSPFGELKALPQDGKPISEWTNINNAFLNITDELRKLIAGASARNNHVTGNKSAGPILTRNYKVEKVFSEVDKITFKELSFQYITKYFQSAIEEINTIDNVQAKFIKRDDEFFTCLISNRSNNKDAYITVFLNSNTIALSDLQYQFTNGRPDGSTMYMDKSFNIVNNNYDQSWSSTNRFGSHVKEEGLIVNTVAGIMWDDFIRQVGIS